MPRICPKCSVLMALTRLDGVEIDYCTRCGGTFLDPGEGEKLVGPELAPELWWSPAVLRGVARGHLRCPNDGAEFQVYTIAHGTEQVQVDVCGSCRGIWLEQDEGQRLHRIVLQAGQDGAPWVEPPGVASYFFQLLSGLPMEVWHPVRRFPKVTLLFLLACVVGFLYPFLRYPSPEDANQWFSSWALVPAQVRHMERWWTLVTCIFLHGSAAHLAGNAYFLYLLGDNTEASLGSGRFAGLVLASGLAGSLAETVFTGDPTLKVVGASGAIAGVMGAYVLLFPRVKLHLVLLFVRFRIPALWYGVAWAAFNVVMALVHTPRIAWMAHLGGFVTGVIFALAAARGSLADRIRTSLRS